MWPYFPELLERAVPRYTSYPTAADFHDGIGSTDMASALDAIAAGTLVSLYVHIPYCDKICWYCGCNTNAAGRSDRISTYLTALRHEVTAIAERLRNKAVISQIAFGGGSPNVLSLPDFQSLAQHVRKSFNSPDTALSVEIDPRGLNRDWVKMLGGLNTAKVSLGVQTFSPQIQQEIGRVQPVELVEQAVGWLRDAKVGSINFDLMYGLPGQTMADLSTTLGTAIGIDPDRIALFGYAHAPNLIARQRKIEASRLPCVSLRFSQAQLGYRKLVSSGYAPVGFDHFARPDDPLEVATRSGHLRRNFQGFTDDPAAVVIGIGATAISVFRDKILQNAKDSGRYRARIAADQFAAARGVIRNAEDCLRAAIIESLLCNGEAMIDGLPGRQLLLEKLEPFSRRGLVRLDANHMFLSADALPYARSIAACFDSHRQQESHRVSNAV